MTQRWRLPRSVGPPNPGGWVDRLRNWTASRDAAALAGALSGVLMLVSMYLLSRQPGVRSSEADLEWYADSGNRLGVLIGLNLGAVAIVAFLWFMAAILRRRDAVRCFPALAVDVRARGRGC